MVIPELMGMTATYPVRLGLQGWGLPVRKAPEVMTAQMAPTAPTVSYLDLLAQLDRLVPLDRPVPRDREALLELVDPRALRVGLAPPVLKV